MGHSDKPIRTDKPMERTDKPMGCTDKPMGRADKPIGWQPVKVFFKLRTSQNRPRQVSTGQEKSKMLVTTAQ